MGYMAISYARFSSAGQADGNSIKRQIGDAEEYAAANGLTIDKTLSFTDQGVSAYDKSNVSKGALGRLLKAVEEGRIKAGTTLIVESFDRLSRATPIDALSVFIDMLNAGLIVITLTKPPKTFSRASIEKNVYQVLEVLVEMHRSHQESVNKSIFLSKAWTRKKLDAQQGTLMTRRAPHWISVLSDSNLKKIDPNKRKATLIPERVKILLWLIEGAEKGTGNHTLIQQLHGDGVPAWSKSGKWQPSYVQKIMRNPALFGAIELDGEICEGYYPAVIDKDRFLRLQVLRSARATTKTTNRGGDVVTNLFSGRLKCGYCGSAMNIAGYKSRKTGYERKYVSCFGARIRSKEAVEVGCKMHMWFLDQLEPKLLFWLTGLDYGMLMGGDKSLLERECKKLAGLEGQITEVARRVGNITNMIEDGEGTKSLVIRQRALEMESEALEKLVKAQRDIVVMADINENNGKSRMDALIAMFKEMKRLSVGEDKIKLRALREQLSASIAQTIKKVTLYPVGPNLMGTKAQRYMVIDLNNGRQQTVDAFETAQGEHDWYTLPLLET